MKELYVSLFFLANIMYTSSYAVRDMMWLRIITVIAAFCTFPYFFFQDTPLWSALFWQSMFIAINAVQLFFLYREKKPVNLTRDQQRLHLLVFRSLNPKELLKLLAIAEWREAGKGETLIKEGIIIDELYLLFSGSVEVKTGNKVLAHIRDGGFMGEMSYITGRPTSAELITNEPIRYLSWLKSDLEKFFIKHPAIKSVMQVILGYDLADKLNYTKNNR